MYFTSGSDRAFEQLMQQKYGGRLPVHVRMILDEFANSATRS